MTDYLQRILRARVYDVARETPLDPAPNLSRRLGNEVLLKSRYWHGQLRNDRNSFRSA